MYFDQVALAKARTGDAADYCLQFILGLIVKCYLYLFSRSFCSTIPSSYSHLQRLTPFLLALFTQIDRFHTLNLLLLPYKMNTIVLHPFLTYFILLVIRASFKQEKLCLE